MLYQVTDFFYRGRVDAFQEISSDASEVREWFLASPDSVDSADFAFASNAFAVERFVREGEP